MKRRRPRDGGDKPADEGEAFIDKDGFREFVPRPENVDTELWRLLRAIARDARLSLANAISRTSLFSNLTVPSRFIQRQATVRACRDLFMN